MREARHQGELMPNSLLTRLLVTEVGPVLTVTEDIKACSHVAIPRDVAQRLLNIAADYPEVVSQFEPMKALVSELRLLEVTK